MCFDGDNNNSKCEMLNEKNKQTDSILLNILWAIRKY